MDEAERKAAAFDWYFEGASNRKVYTTGKGEWHWSFAGRSYGPFKSVLLAIEDAMKPADKQEPMFLWCSPGLTVDILVPGIDKDASAPCYDNAAIYSCPVPKL